MTHSRTGKLKRLKKIWGIPQIPRYLGNFLDSQVFGEFPLFLDIWGISQIPRHLGNFSGFQEFGEFSKFPGIRGISNFDNFLIAVTPSNICIIFIHATFKFFHRTNLNFLN